MATNRLVIMPNMVKGRSSILKQLALNNVTLVNNGNFMVYHVPNEFKKSEVDSTTNLSSAASLTNREGSSTAKISNKQKGKYFKFNENKQLFTSLHIQYA